MNFKENIKKTTMMSIFNVIYQSYTGMIIGVSKQSELDG